MKILDNITNTVRDDLRVEIKKDSRVSIAAACFSMYAYKELKKQLETIDEFEFIFTSPTFVKEKAEKQKRKFYIPRISRETSLYGTEFEIKLRNEMTQRAIAKECTAQGGGKGRQGIGERRLDQKEGYVQIEHHRRKYGWFHDCGFRRSTDRLYADWRLYDS